MFVDETHRIHTQGPPSMLQPPREACCDLRLQCLLAPASIDLLHGNALWWPRHEHVMVDAAARDRHGERGVSSSFRSVGKRPFFFRAPIFDGARYLINYIIHSRPALANFDDAVKSPSPAAQLDKPQVRAPETRLLDSSLSKVITSTGVADSASYRKPIFYDQTQSVVME